MLSWIKFHSKRFKLSNNIFMVIKFHGFPHYFVLSPEIFMYQKFHRREKSHLTQVKFWPLKESPLLIYPSETWYITKYNYQISM